MARTLSLMLGLVLALSACASPVPARLVSSAPSCKEQIQSFLAQTTGQNVQLGDDLFITSDTLLLEPSTALKLNGRLQGHPTVFRLKKQGSTCWIEGKAQTMQLPTCQCKTP